MDDHEEDDGHEDVDDHEDDGVDDHEEDDGEKFRTVVGKSNNARSEFIPGCNDGSTTGPKYILCWIMMMKDKNVTGVLLRRLHL